MGNKESNESAAVKRQAEGGAIPMYELADLSGGGVLYIAAKRALVKNDTKELDELIRAKVGRERQHRYLRLGSKVGT